MQVYLRQAAKPNPSAGPCDSRTWHFQYSNSKKPVPDEPRQTKPTLSPLTRSNRRHGQYVESCCALKLDGILIFRRVKELVSAQPEQEGSQERVRKPPSTIAHRDRTTVARTNNIRERMRKAMKEQDTNANAHTVSTSPRPTDTLRSRVLTPSSAATTSMLFTAP